MGIKGMIAQGDVHYDWLQHSFVLHERTLAMDLRKALALLGRGPSLFASYF